MPQLVAGQGKKSTLNNHQHGNATIFRLLLTKKGQNVCHQKVKM